MFVICLENKICNCISEHHLENYENGKMISDGRQSVSIVQIYAHSHWDRLLSSSIWFVFMCFYPFLSLSISFLFFLVRLCVHRRIAKFWVWRTIFIWEKKWNSLFLNSNKVITCLFLLKGCILALCPIYVNKKETFYILCVVNENYLKKTLANVTFFYFGEQFLISCFILFCSIVKILITYLEYH